MLTPSGSIVRKRTVAFSGLERARAKAHKIEGGMPEELLSRSSLDWSLSAELTCLTGQPHRGRFEDLRH
ncbi:hypothetical protein AA309_15585 [Microvirga vignae]|uniref:Uncharacterized protein n=1 Tax=Microvirga vignae TaxID=1225564 RepID=A0A0H1RBJ3_9HYPH|nr:hypothetical protein AA309_15585 [Microvirga vignae]